MISRGLQTIGVAGAAAVALAALAGRVDRRGPTAFDRRVRKAARSPRLRRSARSALSFRRAGRVHPACVHRGAPPRGSRPARSTGDRRGRVGRLVGAPRGEGRVRARSAARPARRRRQLSERPLDRRRRARRDGRLPADEDRRSASRTGNNARHRRAIADGRKPRHCRRTLGDRRARRMAPWRGCGWSGLRSRGLRWDSPRIEAASYQLKSCQRASRITATAMTRPSSHRRRLSAPTSCAASRDRKRCADDDARTPPPCGH